jgi:hypothetical protein
MAKRDDDDWELFDPFKFPLGCFKFLIKMLFEIFFALVKALTGRLK